MCHQERVKTRNPRRNQNRISQVVLGEQLQSTFSSGQWGTCRTGLNQYPLQIKRPPLQQKRSQRMSMWYYKNDQEVKPNSNNLQKTHNYNQENRLCKLFLYGNEICILRFTPFLLFSLPVQITINILLYLERDLNLLGHLCRHWLYVLVV